MKTRTRPASILGLIVLITLVTLFVSTTSAAPLGTAFTYQGKLADGGNPASGSYDLTSTLYDALAVGNVVGGPLTNSAVTVSNGLFSVSLDFGEGVFTGDARWLELGVRTNGGAAFTTLSPRQPILPVPYAIMANTASNLTGMLPAAQLSGTVPDASLSANVSLLGPGIESAEIADGTIAAADVDATSFNTTFWRVGGNAGTTAGTHFLGTTDNQPLELKVNGLRALRLEDNGDSASDIGITPDGAPNLIAGSPRNFVGAGVVGATIAGGGATNYNGVAYTNSVLSDFGVVGGGRRNTIAADSTYATIAGGDRNAIGTNSAFSAIGGGRSNTIAADYSWYATIAGGTDNNIGLNSGASAIGGGADNNIAEDSQAATIAGGIYNDIGTGSDCSAIGGGTNNNIATYSWSATIAGGGYNYIGTVSDFSAIGGGYGNNIAAYSAYATIAGGTNNDIGWDSDFSAIGGGYDNNIAAYSDYATIPGGHLNAATNYAFAAGRRAKANHQGAFVWGDSTDADIASTNANSVTLRASGGYRLFSNSGATAGVSLAAGGTAWAVISDRNVKKNFQPVDSREVLERLAALPITRWNYTWEADDGVPHLGPMAQDFKAAFFPGTDDKSITTQEADGVELAAIQGLNQKVEAQRAENAELKRELTELKCLVNQLSTKLTGGAR